jgi:hypothetical protein
MSPHSKSDEASREAAAASAAGQAPPQDPAPPPTYAEAQTADAPPPNGAAPPGVDLDAAFANLSLTDTPHKADPDRCLAHLKLLWAFHNMKEDIGYTDGIWSLWNTRANAVPADDTASLVDVKSKNGPGSGPEKRTNPADEEKQALLSQVREKRWAIFVARAVDRYAAWWNALARNPPLTESAMEQKNSPAFDKFPESGSSPYWSKAMLPPLGE